MSVEWLSEKAKHYVADNIRSIGQLELLLLLAGDPDRRWTAESIAEELRTSRSGVLTWLRQFESAKLVAAQDDGERLFRFASANTESADIVKELGEAYRKYRMRVIDLIYAAEGYGVRTLADAFKWRK